MTHTWYRSLPIGAGVDVDGSVRIQIRHLEDPPAWNGDRWFIARGEIKREVLATALAAITSRCEIGAVMDDQQLKEWDPLLKLYCMR
jgi:hypothetical protein